MGSRVRIQPEGVPGAGRGQCQVRSGGCACAQDSAHSEVKGTGGGGDERPPALTVLANFATGHLSTWAPFLAGLVWAVSSKPPEWLRSAPGRTAAEGPVPDAPVAGAGGTRANAPLSCWHRQFRSCDFFYTLGARSTVRAHVC